MTDSTIGTTTQAARDERSHRTRATVLDNRRTETRRAFKTSEFWVFLAVAAAVLITTYVDDNDSLTEWRGWVNWNFLRTGLKPAKNCELGFVLTRSRSLPISHNIATVQYCDERSFWESCCGWN